MNELIELIQLVDNEMRKQVAKYIRLHKRGIITTIEALNGIDSCLTIARVINKKQMLLEYHKML